MSRFWKGNADEEWARLLALPTAQDFVREAMQIQWEFHCRGRENTELHDRFGDAILPWLASKLTPSGTLMNVPWCIVPCLIAIESPEAFAVALGTKAVHERLPGQPALGGGPGAFAADNEMDGGAPDVPEPEDAQPIASTGGDVMVALKYASAHPIAWTWAEALAKGGDARAQAMLAAADHPLTPEAQTILDAAPRAAVPPGPVLRITVLDAAASDYDFPLWDNTNVAVTSSKVRGFVTPTGDVLCIETVAYHAGARGTPYWRVVSYASRPVARIHDQHLIPDNDVEQTEIDDDSFVDGYSNILRTHGHSVRDPFPGDAIVKVIPPLSRTEGEDVQVPIGLPAGEWDEAINDNDHPEHVSTNEALMIQIDAHRRDLLFPTTADLQTCLELGAGAELLFEFDDVEWPYAGKPVSGSIDFVTMIAALKERVKITSLPGAAESRARQWSGFLADERAFDPEDFWPEGHYLAPNHADFPDGIGATPHDTRSIERGWPHGISLVHAAAYNGAGTGRGVVQHWLTPDGARWFMNSRIGATAILRAAGAVKQRWAIDDKGIVASLATETLPTVDEAKELLAKFVAGPPAPFARIGSELIFCCEALIGPSETILGLADAIENAPDTRWTQDVTAVAAAVFELGVLLWRSYADGQELVDRLQEILEAEPHPEVNRMLDLVLWGKDAAERSARCELDYLYVDDEDKPWAKARILDPATPASVEDVALMSVAGDELLQKYLARKDRLLDRAWLAQQLPRVGTPTATILAAAL